MVARGIVTSRIMCCVERGIEMSDKPLRIYKIPSREWWVCRIEGQFMIGVYSLSAKDAYREFFENYPEYLNRESLLCEASKYKIVG